MTASVSITICLGRRILAWYTVPMLVLSEVADGGKSKYGCNDAGQRVFIPFEAGNIAGLLLGKKVGQ